MSIFATRVTKVITIPHDEPNTVTIQKLTGRHLERARQESQFKSVDDLKRMGGAAFQKELASLGTSEDQAKLIAKVQADPLNSFDAYTVLQKGIRAWTYEREVTADAIEELDEDSALFLAREILRLTKPALFATAAEAEAQQKNG